MSVIQKIRTKYAKLAGGVIAVALVAFILMDALSSRSGSLFGNDTSVVTVNGTEVDYMEYSKRTNEYETLYGSNQQMDEEGRAQIYGMALNDLVKERILAENADKLGLTITEAEKKDMIYGPDPDQAVKNYQAFTNPNTKAFDPQYVKLFEEQANQIDPTGKMMEHWLLYKEYIKRNSMSKKYTTLFTSAMYVPQFLVNAKVEQQAKMANIDMVSITAEEISPEDEEKIKLTDEDYKKYVKEHLQEFTRNDPSRTVEYVSFNVVPAARDTARALGALTQIKEEFENTNENESFVNRNSEESYQDIYVMKEGYKSRFTDSVFSAPIGKVIGPLYEENTYKLTKVIDKQMYPDSVRCRHILVNTAERGQATRDDSTAKLRIDSVITALKAGAPFTEMVTQYSDDAGSKEKGGEYNFGFAQKANLSKEFGDFIFNGKPGQTKLVKVENNAYAGYHYIEILAQGPIKPALKIATITKALYPSDETEQEIYANATEFAGNSESGNFDSVAQKYGYQKSIGQSAPSDYTVSDLGPSRELIKWMYNAEVGDVSEVLSLTGKYVVAKLTEIQKAGLQELSEDYKTALAPQIKRQKLLKELAKKYENVKSLQEVAVAAKKEVQSVDSFRGGSSFTAKIGYAPEVVGYVFSSKVKENTFSGPIVGTGAIRFITVKSRFAAPTQDSTVLQREKQMMQMQAKSGIEGQVLEGAKKNAQIKYNVNNF